MNLQLNSFTFKKKKWFLYFLYNFALSLALNLWIAGNISDLFRDTKGINQWSEFKLNVYIHKWKLIAITSLPSFVHPPGVALASRTGNLNTSEIITPTTPTSSSHNRLGRAPTPHLISGLACGHGMLPGKNNGGFVGLLGPPPKEERGQSREWVFSFGGALPDSSLRQRPVLCHHHCQRGKNLQVT